MSHDTKGGNRFLKDDCYTEFSGCNIICCGSGCEELSLFVDIWLQPASPSLVEASYFAFPATQRSARGQVSNGSCLQLADESSARRAGVVKAELERNQVTGSSLQAPEPEPARLPRWIRWGRRMPKPNPAIVQTKPCHRADQTLPSCRPIIATVQTVLLHSLQINSPGHCHGQRPR
ncbi:hypothetical protein Bbelb_226050 [Branchiostoma belcheri]|nr:hypothetical protein Bbelb_226050 [Branchiostoma belcheri]